MKPRRVVESPLGPVMLDLQGLELLPEEREMLQHPLTGGVILFTRNYLDPEQVTALIESIRAVRRPPLLVAVDHEGGDVQRFRDGFTRLPACASIGKCYDRDTEQGLQAATEYGWLMAAELRAVGVDFSFAPVLDLGLGRSEVIKDRAYHREAAVVSALAGATVNGMRQAGMAAVGKHFPGHGWVVADSHHEAPVDERNLEAVTADDLVPFRDLIADGLAAVMPAHVIYANIDDRPAGFSNFWIQDILRQRTWIPRCGV